MTGGNCMLRCALPPMGSKVFFQDRLQRIFRYDADGTLQLHAVLEEDQGRNGGDAESLRQGHFAVRVNLSHQSLSVVFLCQFFNYGAQDLAGTAPGCSEVHHGQGRRADRFVEAFRSQMLQCHFFLSFVI